MQDIELPSRENVKTVGDMARLLVEDEKVISLKNADLAALRQYAQSGSADVVKE